MIWGWQLKYFYFATLKTIRFFFSKMATWVFFDLWSLKNLGCFCHPEKNWVHFTGLPSNHFLGCRLNKRWRKPFYTIWGNFYYVRWLVSVDPLVKQTRYKISLDGSDWFCTFVPHPNIMQRISTFPLAFLYVMTRFNLLWK